VVGDFNEDGNQDVVATNTVQNAPLSVFLGNGDGTFAPMQSSPLGAKYGIKVVTADFNGDSHLDLAVADLGFPYSVWVVLGNGDGTFGAPRAFSPGPGALQDVATADFNGDQIPDLVVANWLEGLVSVLQGNGDGTFQAPRSFTVGGAANAITVADFNRDGRPDIAVVASFQMSTLLGDGQGGFLTAPTYAVGDTPSDVVVADFNGDSRDDVATSNAGSDSVSVLLGLGNGTFAPAANYAVGDGANSIEFGDFNEDCIPDLATANGISNNVSILLGNGDGTFQPAMNFPALNGPVSIALGQFTADAFLDVVVVNASFPYGVTLLVGNGNGTFQPPINRAAGKLASSVDSGDFNGDGLDDLAVESRDFENRTVISILLSNGDGTFTGAGGFLLVNARNSSDVRVAQVNMDGTPDLLITNPYRATVYVALGNGNGTFTLVPNEFEGVSFLNGVQTADMADIDADGVNDLVAVGGRSNLYVRVGNGDGTFREGGNFGTGEGPTGLAFGDFNGNGRPDVAVNNADSNNVSIMINRTRRRAIPPIPLGDDSTVSVLPGEEPVTTERPSTIERSENQATPGDSIPSAAAAGMSKRVRETPEVLGEELLPVLGQPS
jgi:hypothetical protein